MSVLLSWIQVYREMTEWAVLFSLVRENNFANDTVIVRDGFLRAKTFKGLFGKYTAGLEEGIKRQFEKNRRRIYIVGIAKHSKILQAYRLAMALRERCGTPTHAMSRVPRELEEKVYKWPSMLVAAVRENSFVAGKMFLVKFGSGLYDPVWAIDVFDLTGRRGLNGIWLFVRGC